MAVLIANGRMEVLSEDLLREVLRLALAQENKGPLASFAGRLLSLLEEDGEGNKELVALAGDDWLSVEALVFVDREELEDLTDRHENKEVARILSEKEGLISL